MINLNSCVRHLIYYPQKLERGRDEYISSKFSNIEEISIPVEKEIKVRGWLIKNISGCAPLIIYFGGNAEEISWNIEDFILKLGNTGYNIALFNYRGYGKSDGFPTEKNLFNDAAAIYDYLTKRNDIETNNVLCFGRSLGSGVAVNLAYSRNISGLILITPFDSIKNVAKNIFPAFIVSLILRDNFDSAEYVKTIKCPIIIIAAENDEVIPIARTNALYSAIKSKRQFETIKNATHNTISHYDEYWRKITDFILALKM